MTDIQELAIDLVQHNHKLDPYYLTYREELEALINIYNDLLKGNINDYINALKKDLDYFIAEEMEIENTQELIERLNELKEN